MPHTASQKKRLRQSEVRRVRNMSVRSRVKTYVKNAMSAIEAKDAERVKEALPAALSEIDRAASKGVIHKKSAGRKKSTLQHRAAALQK
ncbi:MAG TPA: 30S ribosomal protein S20 [Candidatus Hydrogenedentes bacterium]|nr:30S ribosomal protein S20 [Candidatus Hydrogenedentota bacterium]HPG66338.1 30S ribosomal protein S20 [Candidatus Hydrogenedentota bacterium]